MRPTTGKFLGVVSVLLGLVFSSYVLLRPERTIADIGTYSPGLPELGGAIVFILLLASSIFSRKWSGQYLDDLNSKTLNGDSRFFTVCLLGTLVIAGFALRVAEIGNYALSTDESLFIYASSHQTVREFFAETLTHFHPPSNFLMLHALLRFSWEPEVLRMPSVVGGTLSILTMYLFVGQLFGRLAGLMAAFLTTFSPNLILLSQVCRNYSPGMPFLILALYFLARFLREDRWRWFYWFALFEFLAATWHYVFLVPFLAANICIAWSMVAQKKPWSAWWRVFWVQIPLGVGYLVAIFLHRPLIQAELQAIIVNYMRDEFFLDPTNPLGPILRLIRYLLANDRGFEFFVLGFAFFVLAGLALPTLWFSKRRTELLLCLAPLPLAYFFAFVMKIMPMGGTRHSQHLYPYFFALIAFQFAELVQGAPLFKGWTRRHGSDRDEPQSGAKVRPNRQNLLFGPSFYSMSALCVFYIFLSMKMYVYVDPYLLRQMPAYFEDVPFYNSSFYKVIEAPARQADVDRLANALAAHAKPGEYVLLSLPAMFTLRYALEEEHRPVSYKLNYPIEFEWNGLNFIYMPEAKMGFTANTLMLTAAQIKASRGLENMQTLWVAQAGWEIWPQSLRGWINTNYPGVVIDSPAYSESHGTLFPIRGNLAAYVGEYVFAEAPSPLDRS